MGKIKGIFKNIVAFLVILGIIFFCLELFYRGYKFYKYHKFVRSYQDPMLKVLGPRDRLEYAFKPGAEFVTKDSVLYKINSKGLRDRELSYGKPKDVYRILVLGDSYTFGWRLPLEETFPKLLERMLNEKPERKVEVINAGIYGYSTVQEQEFLKREGIKYKPDLVILGFTTNDAEPQNNIMRSPYLEMEGVTFWFPEYVKFRINILVQKTGINTLLYRKYGTSLLFFPKRKEPAYHSWEGFMLKEYSWKKETCLKALQNMAELASENKAKFLVVIFPDFTYGPDDIPTYSDNYAYKIIDDSVIAACKESKADCLNLYPFFVGKKRSNIMMESDVHFNRKGYWIAAEAVSQRIKELYLK